jgi:molybdopterin converting factor small subunit
MIVRVRLFARARDLAGCDLVEIDLSPPASVAALRERIAVQVPALASLVRRCAVAVGGEYAGDADPVPEGVEAALIPPVSGGSLPTS